MKQHLLLWLLVSPLLVFAQQKIKIDFESLEEIKYPIESIFEWDSKAIVPIRGNRNRGKSRFYYADDKTSHLKPIILIEKDTLIHLSENSRTLFALAYCGMDHFLLTQDKKVRNLWREEHIPEDLYIDDDSHLLSNDRYIAIVGSGGVIYREINDTAWTVSDIDTWHNDYAVIAGNSIYIGTGRRVCPGWFPSRPMNKYDIEKGKLMPDVGFNSYVDNSHRFPPTMALASNKTGKVWFASSSYAFTDEYQIVENASLFTHDGIHLDSLYWRKYINRAEIDTSVWVENGISCMHLRNDGQLYFVVSALGVFKTDGISQQQLVSSFLLPQKSRLRGSTAGIYVNEKEDIYLGSYNYGVFAFIKGKNGYTFKQYAFDE